MIDKTKILICKNFGADVYNAIEIDLNYFHDKEEVYLEFIYSLIKAEVNNDFFDLNHFKNNFKYKLVLTEEISTKISLILSNLYPKENLDIFNNLIFKKDKQENNINKTSQELFANGYSVWPELLSEKLCNRLISDLNSVNFYSKKSHDVINGYSEENNFNLKDSLYRANMTDLLNLSSFQDLSLDQTILKIAQNYLHAPPIHVQTNCWWVSPIKNQSSQELSENAQLFHRDKEYLRFLKVFIYLNDVNELNGPHTYVPQSHLSTLNYFGEMNKIVNRFSDNEIINSGLYNKQKAFTGKKGTVIFEDTYGFHKGSPVIKGHRLMLQLEYANSLFFRYDVPFSKNSLPPKYVASKSRVLVNYTEKNKRKLKIKNKWTQLKNKSKQFIKRHVIKSYE